ncbi:Putative ribonuclease H protein At1g65750 [Linum grandiflorum]
MIGWRLSDESWFTLSTDGLLWSPQREAAAGRVIGRDDKGSFVKAFATNLDCCSITRAGMQGIVEDLKLAWSLAIWRIRVQSDSTASISFQMVLRWITNTRFLSCSIRSSANDNERLITLTRIYREANCAADYLANLGHYFVFGFHIVDV